MHQSPSICIHWSNELSCLAFLWVVEIIQVSFCSNVQIFHVRRLSLLQATAFFIRTFSLYSPSVFTWSSSGLIRYFCCLTQRIDSIEITSSRRFFGSWRSFDAILTRFLSFFRPFEKVFYCSMIRTLQIRAFFDALLLCFFSIRDTYEISNWKKLSVVYTVNSNAWRIRATSNSAVYHRLNNHLFECLFPCQLAISCLCSNRCNGYTWAVRTIHNISNARQTQNSLCLNVSTQFHSF